MHEKKSGKQKQLLQTSKAREVTITKQSFNNSPRELQETPMNSAQKNTTLCQKMNERKR